MDIRKGFSELFRLSADHAIPIVIFSAGVSDVIEKFLHVHRMLAPNVHIEANRLDFGNDGFCRGCQSEIIHLQNKTEQRINPKIQERIHSKKDVILLGDSLADVMMIGQDEREHALKIGFVSGKKIASIGMFREAFDIVIESAEESYGVPVGIVDRIIGRQE